VKYLGLALCLSEEGTTCEKSSKTFKIKKDKHKLIPPKDRC